MQFQDRDIWYSVPDRNGQWCFQLEKKLNWLMFMKSLIASWFICISSLSHQRESCTSLTLDRHYVLFLILNHELWFRESPYMKSTITMTFHHSLPIKNNVHTIQAYHIKAVDRPVIGNQLIEIPCTSCSERLGILSDRVRTSNQESPPRSRQE